MPAGDPEDSQPATASVPLRPVHLSAIPFLKQHGTNHSLQTVRRWSDSVGDLLVALGEEPVQCRCAHQTAVHLVQLTGALWEDLGIRGGVSCVFGRRLFSLIANVALTWLHGDRGTVGVILLYRKSVDILEAWKATLPETDQSRLVIGTPESLQGETFRHAVFLSLQKRTEAELTPGGHCLHRGRRLVGVTRSTHTLLVLGEYLYPAEDPWTRKLQGLFQHFLDLDNEDCPTYVSNTQSIFSFPIVPKLFADQS